VYSLGDARVTMLLMGGGPGGVGYQCRLVQQCFSRRNSSGGVRCCFERLVSDVPGDRHAERSDELHRPCVLRSPFIVSPTKTPNHRESFVRHNA
jgi:hypothetical protein